MSEATRPHRLARMTGRATDETHRAATPLELLFDLTFVIAFGTAADQLTHGLAEGHLWPVLIAFCFVTFAISWAWINFAWFASAYDTDDWLYRLTTMVQMVGVLILALGLPAVFRSIEHHEATLDNRVMVLGYVVMRVAMGVQWLRAAREDPSRRSAQKAYLVSIFTAQVLWCVLAVVDLGIGWTFAAMVVPLLVELVGPYLAETYRGGTPWHPHHIAERYSLMVIIALGEGLLGTMATLTALAGEGLSTDIVLLAFAGTSLAFGLWWTYYTIPHGEALERWRERSFGWGYGHIVLFGSIVAIGAGLHVAASFLEGKSHMSLVATVSAVAVPTALYLVVFYALLSALTRTFDALHLLNLVGSAVVIGAALAMAAAGVEAPWCLAVLALTPWVTVIGYETYGYRHNADLLAGA
ncbi:low temperature requirement protein A [Nocardioides sp.]|uniref:low temperature requirement protein A n=1 Tax=Nocardioides sp. TaxID=35761 RepID=UPI002603CEA1|nr:low temperature requirement protein A [Nocardioides sp.]